jgi:hypothetical protein
MSTFTATNAFVRLSSDEGYEQRLAAREPYTAPYNIKLELVSWRTIVSYLTSAHSLAVSLHGGIESAPQKHTPSSGHIEQMRRVFQTRHQILTHSKINV